MQFVQFKNKTSGEIHTALTKDEVKLSFPPKAIGISKVSSTPVAISLFISTPS
jgi:hypothetical protein